MARILLVEPDWRLAQSYVASLRQDNHDVLHCKESGEAISTLDEHSIDIVILEIQIALHNGIEFLYEMRSYSDWQSIPIIINSVVPSKIIEQNVLLRNQFAIAEVLYKPSTTLKMLTDKVRSVLKIQEVS